MVNTCRCGSVIPPQAGPGRPRRRCEECSPRRPRSPVPAAPKAVVTAIRRTPAAGASLVESTRARLAEVGRDGSPEGLVALLLAGELENGGGSQSGLAALAKQFQVALDVATKDAGAQADVIDGIFGT